MGGTQRLQGDSGKTRGRMRTRMHLDLDEILLDRWIIPDVPLLPLVPCVGVSVFELKAAE